LSIENEDPSDLEEEIGENENDSEIEDERVNKIFEDKVESYCKTHLVIFLFLFLFFKIYYL
jgi:hypothetical protein